MIEAIKTVKASGIILNAEKLFGCRVSLGDIMNFAEVEVT